MKKYLLPLVFAGAAFAQSTTSVSTSETTLKPSLWDKIKKNSSMSYFSQMSGPGIATPTNTNTLDDDNNPEVGSPINIWNQVSYRYQVTKDVRFVINPRFMTYFGQREETRSEDTPNERSAAVQNVVGLNPVFGVTIRHQFTDKFSFSGGVNTILANVQEGTIEDGLLANPGGFQTWMYKVNDKLTVGSWFAPRVNFYSKAASNSDLSRWSAYIAPFAEYSIADNTYLRGWIGNSYDQNSERGRSFFEATNDGGDLGLGVDFGINKHFGVYPYVMMTWDNNLAASDVTVTTDNATIGAWFYGSIF